MEEIIRKLNRKIKVPVLLLFIITVLWIFITFAKTSQLVTDIANSSLTILVIINIAWISVLLVKLGKYLTLKQYDLDQKDNLIARKVYTQLWMVERVVIVVIIVIAISLILMTFSEVRKVGISIIASTGLVGLILGFASQKILGGMLAGVQLAFTQPIRLDDVVVVENEWGRIEEINLTYVVVKIWDERRLILPTTYFIEKPFQNWTRTSADILGTVFIYTDYNVPLEKLRNELNRLLQTTDLWDGKTSAMQVTDSTDRTMEIRALMSAENSSKAFDLRVFIRENLILFIQQHYPESLPKSRIVMAKE